VWFVWFVDKKDEPAALTDLVQFLLNYG
jgi:hypothetical protein